MQRRNYLASLGTGIAGFLAGCAEDTDNGTTPTDEPTTDPAPTTDGEPTTGRTAAETSNEPTATDEPTDTTTADSTETTDTTSTGGEANVSIESSQLVENQTDLGTEIAATGTVTNGGDGWAHRATFSARVYNSDDNLLETLEAILMWFGPDQTWEPYIEYYGDGEPDHIETELEVDPPQYTARAPEQISLDESSLNVGEDEASITGTATNNRDETIDYLEATGHFRTEDGIIVSSNYTNVTDLPAGETWQFNLSALVTGDRLDRIANHEVILST